MAKTLHVDDAEDRSVSEETSNTRDAEDVLAEEDHVFIETYRDRRRTSPATRAFEGASMGGPERYTRAEMSTLIESAPQFVLELGRVLRKYVDADDQPVDPAAPAEVLDQDQGESGDDQG